jgi:hypothetical protein
MTLTQLSLPGFDTARLPDYAECQMSVVGFAIYVRIPDEANFKQIFAPLPICQMPNANSAKCNVCQMPTLTNANDQM